MPTHIFIWDAKTNPQPQIVKAETLLAGKKVQGFNWSADVTLYFPPASELNLKNRLVSLPSLTTKDYQVLDFAVSEELDFLALSFVQSSSDVRFLKQALAERGASIPVIAKIERKNALDDIQNIVLECYGIMVARGDLALEMSFEDVPIAQKRIITVCRDEGVPVITATQMLESMINFHKPTRAEAADIAKCDSGWHRRCHALCGIGCRPVPGRSGRNDGHDRCQG